MHIRTIVKVSAPNENTAIDRVRQLVCNGYEELPPPFDWYDEEAIKVSEEIKTEADFKKLREIELKEYKATLKKALKLSDKNSMKGFYLERAGEGLGSNFWSTERIGYDYDKDYGYDEKIDTQVFYIETDRHC